MKKTILLFILSNFLSAYTQSIEYYVKFKNENTIPTTLNKTQSNENVITFKKAFIIKDKRLNNIYFLSVKNKNHPMIKELKESGNIEYIEIVPKYETFFTPNDLNAKQYNLKKIFAVDAWDIQKDASKVKIAIVDDAVLLTHPDLKANIWINPKETLNGKDDDNNGYIDDINGYDVADNDNNPNPPSKATSSIFSHGTHCAGISSAATNNATGIASIGYNAKIIAVKTAPNSGSGRSLPAAIKGVEYAIAAGADIISMSWGGGRYSKTVQTLFDVAHSKGIILVAAAGNSNVSTPMYPAGYNHIISVAATDKNDKKASFSNFGNTIDVSAPGVKIYSTVPGNGLYDFKSGTSMACPLVSGLCALMVANSPGISPDSLEKCLKSSADDIDKLNPAYKNKLGDGRINAVKSLRCIKDLINATFKYSKKHICPKQQIQFIASIDKKPGLTYSWIFNGGTPSTSTLKNPIITYNSAGVYSASLTVKIGNKTASITQSKIITVSTPSATIKGTYTIQKGDAALIEISFKGNSPFSFSYSDGVNIYSKTGILSNKYYVSVSPTINTQYTLNSYKDKSCSGTVSGKANVIVVPKDSNCNSTNFTSIYTFDKTLHITQVISDRNKNIYLCGFSKNGGAVFIKLNDKGKLIYTRNYKSIKIFEFIALATNNNDILLEGRVNGSIAFTRVDPNGNIIWSKVHNFNNERYFYEIAVAGNNNYYIGGMGTGNGGDDLYILKINGQNGSIIWDYSYDFSDDQMYALMPHKNGGVIAYGNDGPSNATYAEIDKNGKFIKHVSYDGEIQFNRIRPYKDKFISVSMPRHNVKYINVTKLDLSTTNVKFDWRVKLDVQTKDWSVNLFVNPTTGNSFVNYINPIDGKARITVIDKNGKIIETIKPDFNSLFQFDFDGKNTIMTGYRFKNNKTEVVIIKRPNVVSQKDCFFNKINIKTSKANVLRSSSRQLQRTDIDFKTSNYLSNITNINHTKKCLCFNGYLNADKLTICTGDSVQLMAKGGTRYQWLPAHGLKNNALNLPNPWAKPTKTTEYTVIISNCDCDPDTLKITIFVKNTTFKLGIDTTFCKGDSLQLIIDKQFKQINIKPFTNIKKINEHHYSLFPIKKTHYIITANAGICSVVDTIKIDIDSCCNLFPDFEINDNLLCMGEKVNITNTSKYHAGAVYTWKFKNATNIQSFIGYNPPTIIYNTKGDFTIRLIITGNCGNDTVYRYLSIIKIPSTNYDTAVCLGDSIKIGSIEIIDYEYLWAPNYKISNIKIAKPMVYIAKPISYFLTKKDLISGCTAIDTVKINIKTIPYNNSDTSACIGDSIQIGSSKTTNYKYSWKPNINISNVNISNPRIKFIKPTSYYLTKKDLISGCTTIDTVKITLGIFPSVYFPTDTTICQKDSLKLDYSGYSYSFLWDNVFKRKIYTTKGKKTIFVKTTWEHCPRLDSIIITYKDCKKILKVFNVFTPNNDGINDQWEIVNIGYKRLNVRIFNRWNQEIYTYELPKDQHWNGKINNTGKDCPSGSYYYIINYDNNNGAKQIVGSITLIRSK